MSRAYRISISESLRRHVKVDDGICSTLELLPILEKPHMGALLAAELQGRGFVREGDKVKRTEEGGIEIEIDLGSGEVKITATGHTEVDLTASRTAMSERPEQKTTRENELRDAAREQLEREAQATEETLRRQVTERLEGRLRDVQQELDGVVNRVTASALKTRAAQLGTIEEVHEDAQTGSLTIKVRV